MILSKNLLTFIKTVKHNKKTSKCKSSSRNELEKISSKIYYLKQIKKKNFKILQTLLSLNFFIKNNKLTKNNLNSIKIKNKLITFILNINFSPTNTRIYLIDRTGNIKKSYSAGSVNLSGKQKIQRYVAFANILKKILNETKTLQKTPIILHLKNVTKNYPIKKIVKILKNNFIILSIKSFNSKQHNGCRPKKLKRLK